METVGNVKMDMNLDRMTVFVLLVLGHLLAVILFSAYRHQTAKDPALEMFYASKWLQAMTWGLFVVSGQAPGMAVIVAANLFFLFGVALESTALLRVTGGFGSKVRRFYLYWTGAGLVAYLLVVVLHNSASLRIAVASLSIAVMIGVPAGRMAASPGRSTLSLLLGYMYLTVAAALVIRTPLALFSPVPVDMLGPGFYRTLSFLALYVIMMLGNTGFFLLSKEQADRKLLRLANNDDLTGALNRRAFMHETRETLLRCRQEALPASFILIDVDHFKTINDSFGHPIGDELLREFAGTVRPLLKAGDLFGRYGGDEFAMFLPGADERTSDHFAESLRAAVAEGRGNRKWPDYTISIGVVTVPSGSDASLSDLFKSSDEALYQAKHAGRNRAARSGT